MTGSVELQGQISKIFKKPADANFHEVKAGNDSLPTLVQLIVSNSSGSARTVTLRLSDGTDWDFYTWPVPAGESIIKDLVVTINPGETLYCKSSNANDLTILCVLVEYGSRFRGRPS